MQSLIGTLEHSACAPHPFGSTRVEQSRRFLEPSSFLNFWPPAITLLNLVVRLRGTFGVKRGNPLKVQSRRLKIHKALSGAVEWSWRYDSASRASSRQSDVRPSSKGGLRSNEPSFREPPDSKEARDTDVFSPLVRTLLGDSRIGPIQIC